MIIQVISVYNNHIEYNEFCRCMENQTVWQYDVEIEVCEPKSCSRVETNCV